MWMITICSILFHVFLWNIRIPKRAFCFCLSIYTYIYMCIQYTDTAICRRLLTFQDAWIWTNDTLSSTNVQFESSLSHYIRTNLGIWIIWESLNIVHNLDGPTYVGCLKGWGSRLQSRYLPQERTVTCSFKYEAGHARKEKLQYVLAQRGWFPVIVIDENRLLTSHSTFGSVSPL